MYSIFQSYLNRYYLTLLSLVLFESRARRERLSILPHQDLNSVLEILGQCAIVTRWGAIKYIHSKEQQSERQNFYINSFQNKLLSISTRKWMLCQTNKQMFKRWYLGLRNKPIKKNTEHQWRTNNSQLLSLKFRVHFL